jgi:hypothetical protein
MPSSCPVLQSLNTTLALQTCHRRPFFRVPSLHPALCPPVPAVARRYIVCPSVARPLRPPSPQRRSALVIARPPQDKQFRLAAAPALACGSAGPASTRSLAHDTVLCCAVRSASSRVHRGLCHLLERRLSHGRETLPDLSAEAQSSSQPLPSTGQLSPAISTLHLLP